MNVSLDLTNLYELAKSDEKMNKCIEFLKVAIDNPKLLMNFVEAGYFFTSHHDVRKCEHDQCDECYSGDTEQEQTENLVTSSKALFSLLPKPLSNDDTDAESGED